MPVNVNVTPVLPVNVVGIVVPAVPVEVETMAPIELVPKTGPAAVAGNEVKNEVLMGAINGVNATFTTLHNFIPGTVQVYLNGVRQRVVDDYNTAGNSTIIMVASPGVGEKLTVDYEKL